MQLMVNHDALEKVRSGFENNAVELNNEFDKYLSEIERLKGVWQGTDSELFCKEAEVYIAKLRLIATTYNKMANFIGKSNNSYLERDESFALDLKKVTGVE